MRIVAASDLHGVLPHPDDVPRGDVLVLAGDICPGGNGGRQSQWLVSTFAAWVADLRVDHVLATWGNHDWVGLQQPPPVPRVRFLLDGGCDIDGVRFWGTPWSLTFFDWAFMADEPELADKWRWIPDATDAVIVHGPPLGYGDLTVDGVHAGSRSLLERLREVKPSLALFGHIHEAAGQWAMDGGAWANVSVLNHHYQLVRAPSVFEIG